MALSLVGHGALPIVGSFLMTTLYGCLPGSVPLGAKIFWMALGAGLGGGSGEAFAQRFFDGQAGLKWGAVLATGALSAMTGGLGGIATSAAKGIQVGGDQLVRFARFMTAVDKGGWGGVKQRVFVNCIEGGIFRGAESVVDDRTLSHLFDPTEILIDIALGEAMFRTVHRIIGKNSDLILEGEACSQIETAGRLWAEGDPATASSLYRQVAEMGTVGERLLWVEAGRLLPEGVSHSEVATVLRRRQLLYQLAGDERRAESYRRQARLHEEAARQVPNTAEWKLAWAQRWEREGRLELAAERYRELGMFEEADRCLAALKDLRLTEARGYEAKGLFEMAAEKFDELGMPGDAEKCRRLLKDRDKNRKLADARDCEAKGWFSMAVDQYLELGSPADAARCLIADGERQIYRSPEPDFARAVEVDPSCQRLLRQCAERLQGRAAAATKYEKPILLRNAALALKAAGDEAGARPIFVQAGDLLVKGTDLEEAVGCFRLAGDTPRQAHAMMMRVLCQNAELSMAREAVTLHTGEINFLRDTAGQFLSLLENPRQVPGGVDPIRQLALLFGIDPYRNLVGRVIEILEFLGDDVSCATAQRLRAKFSRFT